MDGVATDKVVAYKVRRETTDSEEKGIKDMGTNTKEKLERKVNLLKAVRMKMMAVSVVLAALAISALVIGMVYLIGWLSDFNRNSVCVEINQVDGLYINQTNNTIKLEAKLDSSNNKLEPINFNELIVDSTGKSISDYPSICTLGITLNIGGINYTYNTVNMSFEPYNLGVFGTFKPTTEGVTFESLAEKKATLDVLYNKVGKIAKVSFVLVVAFALILVTVIKVEEFLDLKLIKMDSGRKE